MNDNQLFHHVSFRQPEAAQQFIRFQFLLARKLEGADADKAIFGSKVAFIGLINAELALGIILSSFIFRMPFLTATLMFIAYSTLNVATLASIYLLYTASSIASTFFVTAGTFGAMA